MFDFDCHPREEGPIREQNSLLPLALKKNLIVLIIDSWGQGHFIGQFFNVKQHH